MHGIIVGAAPQNSRREPRAPSLCRRRGLEAAPGLDFRGRFIGRRDIERGFNHFWQARHRRAAAPLVASDPVFSRGGGLGRPVQPRALRTGLDFGKLREIHTRRAAGETHAALAAAYGVSVNTISFHLRGQGSASMKAALAATVP